MFSLGAAISSMSAGMANAKKAEATAKTNRYILGDFPPNTGELSEEDKEMLEEAERQIEEGPARQSPRECPSCGNRFRLVEMNETEVDWCPSCKSCWLDKGELAELAETDKDVPGSYLFSRKSKRDCPECGEKMKEYVYQRGSNLLVDRCPEHGVFLDNGELERTLKMK